MGPDLFRAGGAKRHCGILGFTSSCDSDIGVSGGYRAVELVFGAVVWRSGILDQHHEDLSDHWSYTVHFHHHGWRVRPRKSIHLAKQGATRYRTDMAFVTGRVLVSSPVPTSGRSSRASLTLCAGQLSRESEGVKQQRWADIASIVGPDYISLIGGEVRNPRRVLPRAFKSTIYRVFFFYVIGALCVGIVASSDDEALLGAIAAGAPGAAKSPYVICELAPVPCFWLFLSPVAMNRLEIPILPSIVNAAVLVSLFSTTNSFVFAASRSLLGLAQRGQAPKILARTSKRGVPYVAILLTLVVGCLSYLSVSAGSVKVLNWWINLVTAAQLVSWTCIAM